MINTNNFRKIIRLFRRQRRGSFNQRFVPYEKEFLGNTLYIHDIASFNLGHSELFEYETYRFKATRKNPLIIDCGANLGMSIIYFKKLYPDAEIIAFEADDYIYNFLEKNIQSFRFENVKLFNKAVWDSEKTLSFLDEGGAGGRIERKRETGKYKKVETIRLKNFLSNQQVDFLKIDIEGAEFTVIKDCESELENVKNIFIEYHSFPDEQQNLHKILQIVQTAGFRYHIKEAYTTEKPYLERKLNVGMDLQLNIFCYRDSSIFSKQA